MIFSRTQFFLAVLLMVLSAVITPRLCWLSHSKCVQGIMAMEGKGNAGEQIPLNYSVICFVVGKDTIWFNGLGNLGLHPGDSLAVRYNTAAPYDAKVDQFAGIWGESLVYGGIPALMLLVMFLHPTLVPRRSKLLLECRRPFVRLLKVKKTT